MIVGIYDRWPSPFAVDEHYKSQFRVVRRRIKVLGRNYAWRKIRAHQPARHKHQHDAGAEVKLEAGEFHGALLLPRRSQRAQRTDSSFSVRCAPLAVSPAVSGAATRSEAECRAHRASNSGRVLFFSAPRHDTLCRGTRNSRATRLRMVLGADWLPDDCPYFYRNRLQGRESKGWKQADSSGI